MSTLRGYDVQRRKTQFHVPRVQPQSAGLSTVIAERNACGHGNHDVHIKQDAKTRTASLAKDVVVSRLRLKILGASMTCCSKRVS